MSEILETRDGLTLTLHHDQDCESPLEYDEGVFITYNAQSRYTLGNTPTDAEENQRIGERIQSGELIGLPVYAYIHGGVALSTGAFSCPWDSGQSGFIYVNKATALSWHGGKILTAKKREQTLKNLRAIVESFGAWVNGECYGYSVEDADGETLDSCWGFVGYDYAAESAREAFAHCLKEHAESTAREASERQAWACRDVVTA